MDACPSREQLRLILDGLPDSPEREALEAHVATCASCKGILTGLVWPESWAEPGALEQLKEVATGEQAARGESQPALTGPPDAGKTGPPESGAILPAVAGAPAIAGYEVLSELGRGGMGVVYKARQAGLKRLVALKMILHGEHAEPEERARFRTEAEAVARLQHPNIVQIYEVGEQVGTPYFSLELVDGGSLAQKLAGAPQPPPEAAGLIRTLARAIHHAHAHGVVHRDLKPANVLLSPDGTPKITDFGLAKKLDEAGCTQAGAIMGTPSYMAPEQARGDPKRVGPAADVYALGAVLYECLTGRPPFRAASAWDTVLQVLGDEPVPPTRLQPRTPRDLEVICLQCLRKDPARRYASAEALADDLGRFLAGEPIRARPVGRLERGVKWAHRRPAAAALGVLAGVTAPALFALSLAYSAASYQAEWQRDRERVRLDGLREQGRGLVDAGQQALDHAVDVQEARLHLSRALALVETEGSLADLRAHAEALWGRTSRLLDAEAEEKQARWRYEELLRCRDEALFHGMLFVGVDLPANLEVTRTAACRGLALFGAAASSQGPLALSDRYTERQREEVLEGCYELLLVLAEAEAQQPGADGARQALRHLDRAAPLRPPTRALLQRRARYLARAGQQAEAERTRARAAALAPAGVVDHFLLGDEEYRAPNLPQAVLHFERALAARPSHFWAQYFLAVCQLRLERPAEAKAGLTACLGHRPDFFYGYLLRGLAHLQQGGLDTAAADFQKTLDLRPNRYGLYGTHVNRGVLRSRQGDLERAADDFARAAALLPDQYQAHVNLAQVRARQGRATEAAQAFEAALRLVPRRAPVYRTRAQLACERGDDSAALRDYARAIEQEPPGQAEDHASCGRIHHRAGRLDEAVAAYDCALRFRPGQADVHRWRAEALTGLGRHEEAVRAFEQHLRLGGRDADVHWACGQARAQAGDHAGAVADYTLSLSLRPGRAAVHADRGWAYVHCEAERLALGDFDAVIRLEPGYAPGHIGRGYLRVKQGRYAEGAADAERAAGLKPQTALTAFNLACVLALAASGAEADASQPDRDALAERYRARAVALLRDGLQRLPAAERPAFWREHAADPDLSSLRQRSAFRQMQEQYGEVNR
jgi:tetratricopeptide (TPR) repeat protein/tRNA A-37 threonylcarbamoyl transferase component Bud32